MNGNCTEVWLGLRNKQGLWGHAGERVQDAKEPKVRKKGVVFSLELGGPAGVKGQFCEHRGCKGAQLLLGKLL